MKRRKAKHDYDIGEVAIGIMGTLMVLIPTVFLIYIIVTKTSGMCKTTSYGEQIYIKCSKLITVPKIIEQYKITLYTIIYGIFFLSQFCLLIGDKNESKIPKSCIAVIILYFMAWILAIYLTSSFLKSLVLLCLHHVWLIASLGIMASENPKKHKIN